MRLREVTGLLEQILEPYVLSKRDKKTNAYRGDDAMFWLYAGVSLYNHCDELKKSGFSVRKEVPKRKQAKRPQVRKKVVEEKREEKKYEGCRQVPLSSIHYTIIPASPSAKNTTHEWSYRLPFDGGRWSFNYTTTYFGNRMKISF